MEDRKEKYLPIVRALRKEIKKDLVGLDDVADMSIVGVCGARSSVAFRNEGGRVVRKRKLGGTHIAYQGVPGQGKTVAAGNIAHAISGSHKSVSGYPTIMPEDVIVLDVQDPESRRYAHKKGPIRTHVFRFEEISRTNPRTLAVLQEVAEEGVVTVPRVDYEKGEVVFEVHEIEPIPNDPHDRYFFWLVSTLNPLETDDAVYPLPEALKDRFTMCIRVDYPRHEDELSLREENFRDVEIKQVTDLVTMQNIREFTADIKLTERAYKYLFRILQNSRPPGTDPKNPERPFAQKDLVEIIKESVAYGLSSRSSLHFVPAAKAHAFVMRGSMEADIADVRAVALDVARLRLNLTYSGRQEYGSDGIMQEILNKTAVP